MPLPALPSREDLSLVTMRRAFRTTESISALLSAAILWPLVLFLGGVLAATIELFKKAPSVRGLLASILLMTTFFVVVGGLYLLLNWFFSSAGCLVSIVSLALWASFLYLWLKTYWQLVSLVQAGQSDLGITFTLSFAHALLAFFFSHAFRVGLLDRHERAVLSRNPTKEFATLLFGRKLRGITSSVALTSRIFAGVLQLLAKMIQGLAAYVFSFLFGVLLVTVTLTFRIPFDWVSKASQDLSFQALPKWILTGVAVYGSMLVIALLLTHLTFFLKQWARALSRYSFEQIVNLDQRPPTLFLRSFVDDQVTLPKLPLYLKYWLAEPTPRRLDYVLVERFGYLAPVVAIGRPEDKDKDKPFGAARIYVPNSEWRYKVSELAERAEHVVIVVDESSVIESELRGLEWEVQTMLQEPFVDKTLFIASPKLAVGGLENHPLLAPLFLPLVKLSKDFHLLAAFRAGNKWRFLTAKKLTADDYIVCCQAFFRRGLAKTSPELYKKSHE
jgi:hypothetical protein